MTFIWPPMLLTVLLIPLGVCVYRVLERRKRVRAQARSGLDLTPGVMGGAGWLRRRVPPTLFLGGLAVMSVALARPQSMISLPREEGTVILAFDVSGSMAADDLKPTRLAAAKAAARDFVLRQPASVVVGVVAFSDSGISVQTPSNDQATVQAAIDRLSPQKGTSVGQGIRASLNAIAVAEAGSSVDYYTSRSPAPSPSLSPVPPGTHRSAAIVLLTDGENNESPDPTAAAQDAADRGVRIYTVGLGSTAGATLNLNGFRVHTQLDQPTLQQIAQTTGGSYFSADSAEQLKSIYNNLDTQLVVRPEQTEITSIFAGASILLLLAGGMSSLLWLGRLP